MKTKINELTGTALDWAVAKCNGAWEKHAYHPDHDEMPAYATSWNEAGPIIEREEINLAMERENLWIAQIFAKPYNRRITFTCSAETPLIAAMRCYVSSKLGDEVAIPKELL